MGGAPAPQLGGQPPGGQQRHQGDAGGQEQQYQVRCRAGGQSLLQGQERCRQQRQADGVGEELTPLHRDQVALQSLAGPLAARRLRPRLHRRVVVGQLQVEVGGQGMGGQSVVGFVTADERRPGGQG